MALGPEAEKQIAKLLYDSHYANEGAELARQHGNMPKYRQLKARSLKLYEEAMRADPNQVSPAWKE